MTAAPKLAAEPAKLEPADVPRQLTPKLIAERYSTSERLAGDLLRRMKADGVVRKIGKFLFGKLSACDAWIITGAPQRKGGR